MNSRIEDLKLLGSTTAKSGFQNERDIVNKFNIWNKDKDAQEWLKIMGYKINEIEKVFARIIHGEKTDVQVEIQIYTKKGISVENLSVKLVSNTQGFNQIDKRWVDKYVELWEIPKDITQLLKLFTGEIKPAASGLRDKRRMFIDEMSRKQQIKIVEFFRKNKTLVVSDIIKGRGGFSASWMLVVLKIPSSNKWVLKSINHAMNVFADGDVEITERGSLRIGKITMQRKGGDGGRETSKMLQFKINPVELFTK